MIRESGEPLGPVDPDERIELSLMVRPRRPLEELDARLGQPGVAPMSREEFAAQYGADPADLDRVAEFARQHGLEVIDSDQPSRVVKVAGRAADISNALGVELGRYRQRDGNVYRVPDREVEAPPGLEGVVQGVLGLDTRPVAQPR